MDLQLNDSGLNATASGGADAPAPGTRDAGEKWATGQRFKLNATASGATDAPAPGTRDAGEKWVTGQRLKFITPKTEIRLAAWNVRTGHHVGQKEIIAMEQAKYGISIMALSELRIMGSGQLIVHPPNIDNVMTLYYSGGDKREAGVGFMVDRRAASSIIAFKPISERVAVITIRGTITTHVISVYAPTETSADTTKDAFYNQLQLALDNVPQTELIILAGDFNAHTGADRTGWERTLGNFGYGNINDNGLRLLSFAASNNLLIGNSIFQHPRKHQLTWRNPSGTDSAMLDYVLINSRFRSTLKDVRAMRGPDCGSDHYLVRATLQLRLQRAKIKAPSSVKRNWAYLRDPDISQRFQIELHNKFAMLEKLDDIDEEEQQISGSITECAAQVCPPIRRRTQAWITDECLDLVNKRKQVKHVDFEQYRRLNKEVRQRMKMEREAYWNHVVDEMEKAASRNEYRTLYQTIRKLSGKTKSTNDNIKKKDGTFVSSPAERLQRWREFFHELYNHDPPQGPAPTPPNIDEPHITFPDGDPTIDEVKTAITSLKNGKAPGIDQVTAEMIKAGGDILLQRLYNLLLEIWRSEQIPSTWKKAIIVPVAKKGDNRECKNYRGISLLSIVGKVFMKIIQSRLQKHREETSREEQAGFRPNRGCIDQIFALRQLMEERIRCGKRTIIVFIDFKSAFDCIHWPSLWSALEIEHVPLKIINLLQAAYDGSTSCVRIRNELSDSFPIQTGVRQGDVASPLLFNVVVDAIMRKAFDGRRGVRYDDSNFISDLMFADDSAIFADTDTEATDTLYDISRIAESYGLKINADKTKVLTTDGSQATVHLNGTQIEHVREFKYLGSLVQEKKVASAAEICSRIGQASSAFASLKWCVWKKTNISVKTKIRLFRTLILPILLYGAETWTLLKSDLNKLEVFQMRCLRQIIGVSIRDRLRNEEIRGRCDQQPLIEEQIQMRRLRWFGHICRMKENRLPRKLLWRKRPPDWKIQRSAPKKTWAKHIEDDLKNQRLNLNEAKDIAIDRNAWKRIINEAKNPAAPTAAYWLRGRRP